MRQKNNKNGSIEKQGLIDVETMGQVFKIMEVSMVKVGCISKLMIFMQGQVEEVFRFLRALKKNDEMMSDLISSEDPEQHI